jgi:hypothetical protein
LPPNPVKGYENADEKPEKGDLDRGNVGTGGDELGEYGCRCEEEFGQEEKYNALYHSFKPFCIMILRFFINFQCIMRVKNMFSG